MKVILTGLLRPKHLSEGSTVPKATKRPMRAMTGACTSLWIWGWVSPETSWIKDDGKLVCLPLASLPPTSEHCSQKDKYMLLRKKQQRATKLRIPFSKHDECFHSSAFPFVSVHHIISLSDKNYNTK